ncbi:MAG: ABC transporter ATP-binding protein [Betaproteobacteria bacterium]
MNAPVLVATDLVKSFGGVRAVDAVSFAVHAGERVALIGPNGAGKTTCFNLINGQLPPDAGTVMFSGVRIDGLAPQAIARLGVGRTFQVAATFPSMTVRENVMLALLGRARADGSLLPSVMSAMAATARILLDRVRCGELAPRHCATLAYGDVKRVELALALAGAPRLLLMDEPTAGMAPDSRAQLMQLASTIAREDGIAVLFTEHDMDVVFGFADRVLVLDRGRLIAAGTPAEVRANAQVQAVYLGETA